jgi:hypothetical protein
VQGAAEHPVTPSAAALSAAALVPTCGVGRCRFCQQGQPARHPAPRLGYVFCLPRTWKLADGTHLRDLARHLPKGCYHGVASSTPDRRRRDYWVYLRRAELHLLGDVTVLLSKKRRNQGPQQVKLIVTNLDGASATTMLSAYARRWGVEVAFKELKSGLHLGQMQVTGKPGRVVHALLLPVLAYLLLLRLYGRTLDPEQGTACTYSSSASARRSSGNNLNVRSANGGENSNRSGQQRSPALATRHFSVHINALLFMAAQVPARTKARVRKQGMNASLLLRIIEHKLGFAILARNREIGFYDHRSCRIMLAKVLPP